MSVCRLYCLPWNKKGLQDQASHVPWEACSALPCPGLLPHALTHRHTHPSVTLPSPIHKYCLFFHSGFSVTILFGSVWCMTDFRTTKILPAQNEKQVHPNTITTLAAWIWEHRRPGKSSLSEETLFIYNLVVQKLWNKYNSWSIFRFPMTEEPSAWAIFGGSPGILAGTWIGSGATEIQTSAHRACQRHRRQLYPPHHNTGPRNENS